MTEPPVDQAFQLTPRQRRLRMVTLVVLAFIFVMLAFAWFHPFFHPVRPPILTDRVRRALAAQGLLILGYYSIVFLLAMSLVVIAWLYVRDVRLQLLMAQRDIWKEMIERREAERKHKAQPRNGTEE